MQEYRKCLTTVFFLLFLSFTLSTKSSSVPNAKHFVLVHGACHGAWSWYKLVSLLKSSGDNVTAIDLAASGVGPREAKTLTSLTDYFQPLLDFMEALSSHHEKVILVGHSLGGLAISKAMEDFHDKIYVAVFVTAFMPGPTLNISILHQEINKRIHFGMDTRYTYDNGPNEPPTTMICGPLFMASTAYQLTPAEDWTLAVTLMRPQRLFSEEERNKDLFLSEKKYGSVKRVYIMAEKDVLIKKDFQRWMIERNQPNDVVEIRESDHMVLMSKPIELFVRLQGIAEIYT